MGLRHSEVTSSFVFQPYFHLVNQEEVLSNGKEILKSIVLCFFFPQMAIQPFPFFNLD